MTLALWEMGDDGGAIKSARQLLRRDGAFLDMRCALTGALWQTSQQARDVNESHLKALLQNTSRDLP